MAESDKPTQTEQRRGLSSSDAVQNYFGAYSDQAKAHDDRLLWAAGGVFALSISFLIALMPNVRSVLSIPLLYGSWLALAATVVLVFLGLQLSIFGFGRLIDKERGQAVSAFPSETLIRGACYAMNLLALLSLALALVALAGFAAGNLQQPLVTRTAVVATPSPSTLTSVTGKP